MTVSLSHTHTLSFSLSLSLSLSFYMSPCLYSFFSQYVYHYSLHFLFFLVSLYIFLSFHFFPFISFFLFLSLFLSFVSLSFDIFYYTPLPIHLFALSLHKWYFLISLTHFRTFSVFLFLSCFCPDAAVFVKQMLNMKYSWLAECHLHFSATLQTFYAGDVLEPPRSSTLNPNCISGGLGGGARGGELSHEM